MPAVLTGVLVVPLTPAVPAVPVDPAWPEVSAWVLPLMLPAVLGVWLEVLVVGVWLEPAVLEVCGGVVLVELEGYCEVDGFEVAVPLMLPLVPVVELDVAVLEVLGFCSAELDGVVLEELGYELELCGLVLAEEPDGDDVAVEVDGLVLLVALVVPLGLVAEALVPPDALTVIFSFTLVTPGTDFASSFAFLRSAFEATVPSR